MWRSSGLVLLLVLTSVWSQGEDVEKAVVEKTSSRSEVVNVNKDVEVLLAWRNWRTISTGNQTLDFGPGTFGNISYSHGKLIGKDSLVRTEDCTITKVYDYDSANETYDIHMGYELLSIVFDELTIDGQAMSAILSVLDNSAQLTFILNRREKECVKFDVMRYTSFSNVRFRTSRPEYNNYDIEDLFHNAVLPTINKHLDKIRTDPEVLSGFSTICEFYPDTYTVLSHFITILP